MALRKFNGRNNDRQSYGRGGGRQQSRKPAKRKQQDYNMLTFGVGFFDEDGKYPKVRILLKSEQANKPPVDEQGNEYTREEAADLLAQALLEGRGISLYLFENDEGMSGNARIDINGLELSESPAPKKQKPAAKRKQAPPKYDIPQDDEGDDEETEEYEETDDSEPDF